LRKKLGRNEEPSAGCADSQSVKAGSLHANAYDGAKSVNAKKRHLLVEVNRHSAPSFAKIGNIRFPSLTHKCYLHRVAFNLATGLLGGPNHFF